MADQNPSSPPPNDPDGRSTTWPRWSLWVLGAVVIVLLVTPTVFGQEDREDISYGTFLETLEAGDVEEATFNNNTGRITGELVEDTEIIDGTRFQTNGPLEPTNEDLLLMQRNDVEFTTPETSLWAAYLPMIIIFGAFIIFFIWLQRRAAGQMGGVMSIGRSKAKMYSTERPGTTFEDVAGYQGVKQEISEVVDFLKYPEKFAEVGARIPKGVLLVGPPGTGKTLIARAVAGEAGVPFLSVTGSDFMEMFVGVGASRVRDLFQTARKMGRAIIFVDEIDSIGRKRGAGLGGGHDEREQTLNQMLAEMDGFEPAEGIVMMAATNRPDILDPALLRPGRFDRQVVVPLPEYEERKAILGVHAKHKKLDADVDLHVVARGTPGMSGADLANLVNEAALFAVRQGCHEIHMRHFDEARDRVLIGQKREAIVMSETDKELTAYHEGGHAVLAALLPTADELHKVTILPTGMALGATHQLPEERHHVRRDYLEDRIAVALGGRAAEATVYGITSSGASNDLQVATGMARRMVREWGMSERIGPMAWGNQGEVFLGEDLMHSRDYSDDTARIIDEEIERILHEQDERCRRVLEENRKGLDLIARALVEHETIDGREVERLLAIGAGKPSGGNGRGADPVPPDDARSLAQFPAPEAPLPPPPPPPPSSVPTSGPNGSDGADTTDGAERRPEDEGARAPGDVGDR
jgi:cell division protease FtsH